MRINSKTKSTFFLSSVFFFAFVLGFFLLGKVNHSPVYAQLAPHGSCPCKWELIQRKCYPDYNNANCETGFDCDFDYCSGIVSETTCQAAQHVPCIPHPRPINFERINAALAGMGFKFTYSNLGDIISALLPYLFVLAGLILFAFIIWAGFEFLTSAGDPEKVKSAQGKLTSAIVGFIIIFAAYWIAQILQIIFGVSILGG